jgi:uncharacterized protein YceK
MKHSIFVLMVLSLLSGCATTQLEPGAPGHRNVWIPAKGKTKEDTDRDKIWCLQWAQSIDSEYSTYNRCMLSREHTLSHLDDEGQNAPLEQVLAKYTLF